MKKSAFDTAVEFWTQWHARNAEDVWEEFQAAEIVILDHQPTTAFEAVHVLSVLLDQGGDGRSDGRDLEALTRVRAYMRSLTPSDPESVTGRKRAAA